MSLSVSPLAPKNIINLPTIRGVRIASISANVRYKNRDDVTLFLFENPSSVAGVFTISTASAPSVRHSRQAISDSGLVKAISVVAGNANVFTGLDGENATTEMINDLSKKLLCPANQILHSATGIIGEPFPVHKVISQHEKLISSLNENGWDAASIAIGTTDTYPKRSHKAVNINGKIVNINGIAKGSGMIKPQMATMLAYIVSDADIPSDILQGMLSRAAAQTFNCISVDTDTSTSDSLIAVATGFVPVVTDEYQQFEGAITAVCHDLAMQIIRDGEGAKKLIHVTVINAKTTEDAQKIAMSVVESPLVKTAIAAGDANWGRIIAAVGKSGICFNQSDLKMWINDCLLVENAGRIKNYDEDIFTRHLQGDEIEIKIDLAQGNCSGHAFGCDLTHEYIKINADYRS